MSEYIGFFVRDNLGQTPSDRGTAWSSCPDIICAGTSPSQDPSAYLTAASYNTSYPATVYEQTPNYIYVRAYNTNSAATSGSPITGRAWYYWVQSDLTLWPTNWNTSAITVAGNNINYQDIVTTADDQVCMPNLPYIWTPPVPASGQHFCLISWMEYPPSNPPQNPVLQYGYMGTWDDLVNFVLDHQNMGWRNTTDVSGLGQTWSQTSNITGPTTPGTFYLGIQCTNMQGGGYVGFDVPGPNPQIPPVQLPKTPITNPNMNVQIPISDWPGNAQSSITVNYWQGSTPPPAGSNITVTLMIPTTQMAEATVAKARSWRNPVLFDLDFNDFPERHRPEVMVTPITVMLVGAQGYNF